MGVRITAPVSAAVAVTVTAAALVVGLAAPPSPRTTTSPASAVEGTPTPGVGAPTRATEVREPAGPTAPVRLRGHSLTDPSSPWVVVNKRRALDPGYRPRTAVVRGYQVARVAAAPLEDLMRAADREGLGLKIASAFRSYGYQQQVHAAAVATRGREAAELRSARPGHSEHQTGLAVDLVTPADTSCSFDPCFGEQPAGRWLERQAWRHGFIVRYLRQDTAVTGYEPEPWHLRFVGRRLAAELHRTGVTTLEEYFDVPGGDYRR